MKRLLLGVVVVVFAAIGLIQSDGGSQVPARSNPRPSQEASVWTETVTATIGLDGGRCVIVKGPEKIIAQWGHIVTVQIQGTCAADQRITAGNFKVRGKDRIGEVYPEMAANPVESVDDAPAVANAKILIHLRPRTPDSAEGHYTYQILLGLNQRTHVLSPRDPFSLFRPFEVVLHAQTMYDLNACPFWPC